MDEKKLTHKPHVGPEPVRAKPNAVREKTYEASNSPDKMKEERQKTPIRKAETKVDQEMPAAVDKVKSRL